MQGKHNGHIKGSKHYRWARCPIRTQHGYIKVRVGKSHPLADPNGYAYEHAIVWLSAGQVIPSGHVIHHRNVDRADNRLENLECVEIGQHNRMHNRNRQRDGAGRFVCSTGVPGTKCRK